MMQGRPSLRLRRSYSARCRVVRLMLSGLSPQAASRACGMSRSTAYRLLGRYRAQGWDGLRDRPPIARHHPRRLSVEAEMQIVELRRRTGWGPRSLSAALGRPASTIWRVLKRYDCSRAARQPRPPANRYEYAAVGELIHLDISGWADSGTSASASWPMACTAAKAPAGHTHTSLWMTTHDSATSSCADPKASTTASRSRPRSSPTTPGEAHPSNGS